jgi:hypothetical protein
MDGLTRHIPVARPPGSFAVQIGYPADLSRRVPDPFTPPTPAPKSRAL